MVSKPRVKYPNICYHIYSRGVDQRIIFFDDNDFKKFLSICNWVQSKRNFKVHAYCLMHNHYHFCIETPDENIGDIMRDINSEYVVYFNRKYQRKGRLFEGPYQDKVIGDSLYFLVLISYIHSNPLAAGLIQKLDEWTWSSYRSYIQNQNIYLLVDQSKTLRLLKNMDNFIDFHHGSLGLIQHPIFSSLGFIT